MKEIRSENIKVRLTPSEKEKLQQMVEEYGVRNISDFIRHIVLDGKYRIVSEECEEAQSDILYHLSRIGNNLNQIGRYINIQKELDVKVLEELQKIRELLEVLVA